MLCYVMICYDMSYYVMLCYVILCYVTFVMLRYVAIHFSLNFLFLCSPLHLSNFSSLPSLSSFSLTSLQSSPSNLILTSFLTYPLSYIPYLIYHITYLIVFIGAYRANTQWLGEPVITPPCVCVCVPRVYFLVCVLCVLQGCHLLLHNLPCYRRIFTASFTLLVLLLPRLPFLHFSFNLYSFCFFFS